MNNLFKKVVSSVALIAMLAALIPTASFAATISEGDLVKASGSSAIYLIQDGKKRVFPHSSVYLSWGYPANYSTVKTVTSDELSAYPDGDPVIYRDGFMFRFNGVGMTGGFDPSAVFFVSDGKVRPIDSASTYMKLFNGGVNESSAWDRVYWIPDDLLAKFTYPQGSNITSAQIDAGQLPDGLVVRDTNSLYYVVNGGLLSNISSTALSANRYTANSNVFSKMLVTKLGNSVLNLMPAGAAITSADSSLLTVKKLSVQPSTTNVILSSDKTSVDADGSSYATLTATVPSTVTSVSFAITSGNGMLSAYTVTPVSGVATVKVTPTASSVSSTLTVSASATGLTSASVTLTTVANALAPQVVSVSNQGMRIINVVFDKAVDKDSAQTLGNYIPKNDKTSQVSVKSAKLLDDGKTVQLYLQDGTQFYNNSTEDSIEIKNVQNVAQTAAMSSVTKLLTVADASVPTVVAVEALGSKAIRVTFSEAVQNVTKSAFRLDDKELIDSGSPISSQILITSVQYPDGAVISGDYTKAIINFTNPITVGAHTLTVSYNGTITDWNVLSSNGSAISPNIMQPAGYVATVVADTSVPTLSSVEALSQTKVRYTFSKAIPLPTNTSFYWSSSANVISGVDSTTVVKVSDAIYDVTWNSAINTGTIYFYAKNTVTDYSGNAISSSANSKSAVISSDIAPAISSVSMSTDPDSDKMVVVYFNKDVEESSAENESNYIFKDSSSVVLTSTTGGDGIGSNGNPSSSSAALWYGDDGSNPNKKKVVLTLGSGDTYALPGGTYQLCISNIKAFGGTTAMGTQCSSFTVTDKTRPTIALNGGYPDVEAAVTGTSSSRIVINYSEPMGSSALSSSNYQLSTTGRTDDYKKLSSIDGGANISFKSGSNNKTVIIDLPSIKLNNTASSNLLKIGYIEGATTYTPTDANNNLFKASSSDESVTLSLTGDVALGTGKFKIDSTNMSIDSNITSMKVTSPTTLEVTFSKKIESISNSEFEIYSKSKGDYQVASSATINSDDAHKVLFTIPSGSTSEFTSNDLNTGDVKIRMAGVVTDHAITYTNTTKDELGLKLKVDNGATPDVAYVYQGAFTNDIRPAIKSWVFIDADTISVAFDGKINHNIDNLNNLAHALILTQTVGSTTTTASGSDLSGVVLSADSTIVRFNSTKSFDINSSATLKTVSADSIIAVGSNGARVAATVDQKQNASFVATSLVKSVADNANNFGAANESITIEFNKIVKPSSIISGWDGQTVNTTPTASVSTDGIITFNGASIGQIKTGLTTSVATGKTTSFAFTNGTVTNTLRITFTQNIGILNSSIYDAELVYEGSSSVTTETGVSLTTDFKPTATIDTEAPTLVSAVVTNHGVDNTIDAADTIAFTFNEATAKPTLTAGSFTITSGYTFGEGATFVWSTDGKVLTVTLAGTPTIVANDTIAFATANTVTDVSGNNYGTGTLYTVVANDF